MEYREEIDKKMEEDPTLEYDYDLYYGWEIRINSLTFNEWDYMIYSKNEPTGINIEWRRYLR
jgi:hypothetical protein